MAEEKVKVSFYNKNNLPPTIKEITNASTDDEIPSAKAVNDELNNLPIHSVSWLVKNYPNACSIKEDDMSGYKYKVVFFTFNSDTLLNPPDGIYVCDIYKPSTDPTDFKLFGISLIAKNNISNEIKQWRNIANSNYLIIQRRFSNNKKYDCFYCVYNNSFIDTLLIGTSLDPWYEIAQNNIVGNTWCENNFLKKTNAVEYTPTSDYHPTTKKYVDDTLAQNVSDYNQNDETAPNYIKNRPGGYYKDTGFNITWDGVIGDRYNVDTENGIHLVKVSDEILTKEDLIGAKFSFISDSESGYIVISEKNVQTIGDDDNAIGTEGFAVINKVPFPISIDKTITQTGTYFFKTEDFCASCIEKDQISLIPIKGELTNIQGGYDVSQEYSLISNFAITSDMFYTHTEVN